MISIRYNNSTTMIPVTFSRTENTVTLTGTTTPNVSGFHTYRLSGQELGDFSDFTTIYRVTEDSITYSNDGSVYVEPIPHEPTEEEIKDEIRHRREAECFSIINRGTLWYSRLSDEQIAELNTWYSEWLDAPATGVIPEKPIWIDNKEER